MTGRQWPRSLKGQMLLAVALALLFAQAIHAVLLYQALAAQRRDALIHTIAFRLIRAARGDTPPFPSGPGPDGSDRMFWLEHTANSPLGTGESRDRKAERNLKEILHDQDLAITDVIVIPREVLRDRVALQRLSHHPTIYEAQHRPPPQRLFVAAVKLQGDPQWTIVRAFVPPGERMLVVTLILQTLLIYAVLVGAIAVILRRITKPLVAMTQRFERFAETHDPSGQIEPVGPDDVRRLIQAHNAMESRISALLVEKDVMLGAIGHDLKTPLAALRVRIESVAEEAERAKLAATIEDMNRSLDDILSLARVGHAREPLEPTELSALIASIVEEFEDMGEPVTFENGDRVVLPLRAVWLRRALRNLVGNALRYGGQARVSLAREDSAAVIRVEDNGAGIPEADMARMFQPFTRGEPSRNTTTGGAGLGLALARTIADQHGGTLSLSNRRAADGRICGLTATLRLPV